MKVNSWPYQLKENCFWASLLKENKEKVFAISLAALQAPSDVLICSSNETTPVVMAETGVTVLLGLWLSTVISQDPPVICTGQTGE